MSLGEIGKEIEGCRECGLWKGAKNAVPGEGPADARIMLVGQNPGAEEDKTGRPFVGRAGRYLDRVLEDNCIDRASLFITSVVKHKSPGNRRPTQDEIGACLPYLLRQIEEIRPDIIVLMGKVAQGIPRREGIGYLETCHPAAAMRFPEMGERFERNIQRLRKMAESP